MSPKPPISLHRPSRPIASPQSPPTPISHAPVPNIDPEGPDAMAFTMRGRSAAPSATGGGEGRHASEAPAEPRSPPLTQSPRRADLDRPMAGKGLVPLPASEMPYPSASQAPADDIPLISIKLPPGVGRQLGAVADRRGSKRTIVAVEALSEPLRRLAAEHRAGRFPELPHVVAGTVRSSIAFALPADLAADLAFVLQQRRAVRAQVVTRLLVPAIEQLYAAEIGGGASNLPPSRIR